MALAISIPFGILSAVYLAEIAPNDRVSPRRSPLLRPRPLTNRLSVGPRRRLRLRRGRGAAIPGGGLDRRIAGAVALSILMIPVIMLTAEDAIRAVPQRMKEAAIGMGATQTEVIWHILIPTAFPGILTGVMLAVARAAGETAPLLFTVLFASYVAHRNAEFLDLLEPTASLAVLINNGSSSPRTVENQNELAWAAALVLVATWCS